MKARRIVGPALVATAAVGLVAVVVAPAVAEDSETVTWGACPDEAVGAETLECATVAVPLDYDEPDGPTIDIAISRLASTDPDKRRGVLMLNPGGPGGIGLSQPADLDKLGLPTTVTASYDLIGMDPRGVGLSAPVSCGFTDEQGYRGNVPPYAADDAAVTEQAEAAEKVAKQCADNDTEGLLPHISTANTARDMDVIREALGEEKINYFGVSYGTALGSAYASLFPEHTDRVVIDSNIGDTALGYEGQRRYGQGMADTFPAFAKWAAERDDSYGLGATPEEVEENFLSLADRLDTEPVDVFDGAMFRLATFAGVYNSSQYKSTAQLFQWLSESDEQSVRDHLADDPVAPWGTPAAGKAADDDLSVYDNGWSAYLAVNCNDTDWPRDVATYREAVAQDRETFPLFGAAGANINPCAFWPNDPREPKVEVNPDGPSNVLVLQNRRDPATPHAGGEQIREAFGDRARMVSVDDSGHGVYVYADNPCALNITTKYLVDGDFPKSDRECGASGESGLDLTDAQQRDRDKVLDRLGR